MRWVLFLIFSFFLTLSYAQSSYTRISSSGPIPSDFLSSSLEKYEEQLEKIPEKKGKILNAKKRFYQGSFYYINELLLSGKILYNDPVSNYLSQIIDTILWDDPDLRASLKVYTVKSPSVNAFTSIDGKIFVNLGLLAHVKNEAQLAYILTHEISHFKKQHALDIFLHNKGIDPLKKERISNILLESNHYSKEKEQDADIEGLKIFLNTSYEPSAAVEVFDILKHGDRPFIDLDFERSFLEKEHLVFPDNYYLPPDSILLDIDSSSLEPIYYSSHPSPEIRQNLIKEKLQASTFANRELWLLGKSRFYELQKIARFESCFLFLQQQKYEMAIYCSYGLLEEYPHHPFLEKIVVKALYGLAKYASVGRLWDVHVDHEEVWGKSRQLNHMINKMPDQELCILAGLHCWDLRSKYPEDLELQLMSKDLMKDLGQFFVDSISWFQIKTDSIGPQENNFIRFAFSDLMKEQSFRKELGENLRIGKARNLDRPIPSDQGREIGFTELDGFKMGLKEAVFVNPSFQRIDERKEKTVRFLSSEKAELSYIRLIQKHSKKLGLKNQILSKHKLAAKDEELFKDLSLLNEWVEEKNRYDKLSLVSINHNKMQGIYKKYGTPYFIWTGGISIAQKRKDKSLFLGGGILFPPALPYSLYYNLSPQYNTFFYTMVFDIEKGEYLLRYPKWIKMKDEFDVLNSITYDLLYQLTKYRKQ